VTGEPTAVPVRAHLVYDAQWMRAYEEVRAFAFEHGRLPGRADPVRPAWCSFQRRVARGLRKHRTLSAEQKRLLE
jgi:hypothetical protein